MKTPCILILLLCLFMESCSIRLPEKNKWEYLFKGENLDGWETYLGPHFDTTLNRFDTMPIGLNIDPSEVFSLVKIGNEKVLRISGESFGGISTLKEFENFHLQLQFKWGTMKWAPRKNKKRDSGLLYFAVGPHGADGKFWMRSQEFQIEETDCGDYWGVAGATMDIRAVKDSTGKYVYNAKGALLTFSDKNSNGRYCRKYPDSEKPVGEWNTIDLYCVGSSSVHMVNGVVNMVLQNSRQHTDSKENPLSKGKIQIQSEGSEIFYRNIKICSIDKLPEDMLKNQ